MNLIPRYCCVIQILPLIDINTLTQWPDDNVDVTVASLPSSSSSAPPLSTSNASSSTVPLVPPSTTSVGGRIQFPVNPTLNRKLILCQDDLLSLKVDALVWCTNEKLSDLMATPLGSRLVSYGGANFVEEVRTILANDGGVATGESTLMSSHALGKRHGAARHVIATVAPKYSQRFQTAAENALHGCVRRSLEVLLDHGLHTIAFPLLTPERKEYPIEPAVHVILRTLRKFLERYGEKTLHKVIICLEPQAPANNSMVAPSTAATSSTTSAPSSSVTSASSQPSFPSNDEIYSIYHRLLPLYFPRTDSEAALQLTQLPSYSGNELGETVVDERRIRIVEGIGHTPTSNETKFIAAGPTPYTREQWKEEIGRMPKGAKKTESSESASTDTPNASKSSTSSVSSSSVLPTSTFFPARTEYVSPADMPVEPRSIASSSSSVVAPHLPRHHDIVRRDHGFASADEDPDIKRIRAQPAASWTQKAMEEEENHQYYQYLKYAQSCSDGEMKKLDSCGCIYEDTRRDVLGRRILHFVGQRVPLYHSDGSIDVTRQHLTYHAIRTLDEPTRHPFVAIYWHAGVDRKNRPDVSWFREVYSIFTRFQRNNMKQLIIVHPTWYLRSAMYVLASFVSESFWSRLVYCYQLSELKQYIDPNGITIPDHVLQYDRVTYGASALTQDSQQDEPGL